MKSIQTLKKKKKKQNTGLNSSVWIIGWFWGCCLTNLCWQSCSGGCLCDAMSCNNANTKRERPLTGWDCATFGFKEMTDNKYTFYRTRGSCKCQNVTVDLFKCKYSRCTFQDGHVVKSQIVLKVHSWPLSSTSMLLLYVCSRNFCPISWFESQ